MWYDCPHKYVRSEGDAGTKNYKNYIYNGPHYTGNDTGTLGVVWFFRGNASMFSS